MNKNPLITEKNKLGKVILRLVAIIVYIILIPIELTILFDGIISKNNIAEMIVITVLFGFYTYYLLESLSNKRAKCLKYVNKYIKYKDILKHMEGQKFNEIEELNDVFESELWFKIDGYFIPKNFILGMYSITQIARYGRRNQVCIALITGEKLIHFVGTVEYNKKTKLKDNFIRIMSEKLPNANISENNSMKAWYERNKDIIKDKFNKYISGEKSIFELINSGVYISEYKFNRSTCIDDSDEYFKNI